MAWKHIGDDRMVEVVLESRFERNLIDLATCRPVWIVDSEFNRSRIDDAWRVGAEMDLFEVNRYPLLVPEDRKAELLDMIGVFDDQYQIYNGLCVHGLAYDSEVAEAMAEGAFRFVGALPDGFCVSLDQPRRNALIWR